MPGLTEKLRSLEDILKVDLARDDVVQSVCNRTLRIYQLISTPAQHKMSGMQRLLGLLAQHL